MCIRQSGPKYPILLYHGVTSSTSEGIENYSKKHIDVSEFEKQISYIRDILKPVTLREMAKALSSPGYSLPKGSVAVTFDDSYKNTYNNALPILSKYNVPATFFVSTGFIASNRRYWADLLEHIINKTKINHIDITLRGQQRQYNLGSYEERIKTVIDIKSLLKKTPPADRYSIMENLKEMLEVYDSGDNVPNYENLTWKDVSTIDKHSLFEVGGHTVNHEILSYLDEVALHTEIFSCLKDLREFLGHKVDMFSYPEGQPEHFNEKVISVLREAGIEICPTAIYGFNYPNTKPFYLKRIMVGFMGIEFPYCECPSGETPQSHFLF